MKRSKALSLLLMGSLTLGGGVGCSKSDKEQFSAYSTVTECIEDGKFTDQECQEFASQAGSQSVQFSSREDCEARFGEGACEADSAAPAATTGADSAPRTSSWAPMFWGFMAGRYLAGGQTMQGATPLYRAGAGGLRTPWGESVSPDAKGRVAPTAAMRQNMNHVAKPRVERQTSRSGKPAGGFNKNSRSRSAS